MPRSFCLPACSCRVRWYTFPATSCCWPINTVKLFSAVSVPVHIAFSSSKPPLASAALRGLAIDLTAIVLILDKILTVTSAMRFCREYLCQQAILRLNASRMGKCLPAAAFSRQEDCREKAAAGSTVCDRKTVVTNSSSSQLVPHEIQLQRYSVD